jgi:hypothetical protein
VTTGLILNLNANSYSGSGTSWSDLSPQNNSATLVGNPTFSSNPSSFTFAANVIATTTQNNISLTTATFIAWVNPSQTQGSYTGIIFSRNPYGGSTVQATGMDLYTNNSVGYHWADNGATYNWNEVPDEPTDEAKEFLLSELKQRIDNDIVVESQKTGFRPTTRDRRPIVGFAKDNDLLGVFGGLGSKGVLLAPYFSKLFASVLTEGTSIPKEVSAARF